MEEQVKENTNKIHDMELETNTLKICMENLEKNVKEIKELMTTGFRDIKNEIRTKDKDYWKSFATKEELKDVKGKRLTNNPIFVSVVSGLIFSLLIIALKNLGQL